MDIYVLKIQRNNGFCLMMTFPSELFILVKWSPTWSSVRLHMVTAKQVMRKTLQK